VQLCCPVVPITTLTSNVFRHVLLWFAGLDYTRPAFGPCTTPGVPAETCKVPYVKEIATDDKQLDDPKEPHGTNVAGIIVGE
jgi:hypothetical protein